MGAIPIEAMFGIQLGGPPPRASSVIIEEELDDEEKTKIVAQVVPTDVDGDDGDHEHDNVSAIIEDDDDEPAASAPAPAPAPAPDPKVLFPATALLRPNFIRFAGCCRLSHQRQTRHPRSSEKRRLVSC